MSYDGPVGGVGHRVVGVCGEGHRNTGVSGGSFPHRVQGSHGPPPAKARGCSGQGSAGVMTPLRLRCSPHSRPLENQPGAEFDGAGMNPGLVRNDSVLRNISGGAGPWPLRSPSNYSPGTCPGVDRGGPELCLDMIRRQPRRSDVLRRQPRRSDVLRQPRCSDVLRRQPRRSDVLRRKPRRSDVLPRQPRRSDVLRRKPRRSAVLRRNPRHRVQRPTPISQNRSHPAWAGCKSAHRV